MSPPCTKADDMGQNLRMGVLSLDEAEAYNLLTRQAEKVSNLNLNGKFSAADASTATCRQEPALQAWERILK